MHVQGLCVYRGRRGDRCENNLGQGWPEVQGRAAEAGRMKQEGSFRRCNAYLVIVTNPKQVANSKLHIMD